MCCTALHSVVVDLDEGTDRETNGWAALYNKAPLIRIIKHH